MAQNTDQLENSVTHIPVLLKEFIQEASPIEGYWLDGTFGAGGYTKALIEAGAKKVIALDCDPEAYNQYCKLPKTTREKTIFIANWFGDFDHIKEIQFYLPLDGVVFDLGVSSLQFDQNERGFSLKNDGPLDMRMSQSGISAAELVNQYSESQLADLFFLFGEERAARKIARGIVNERMNGPINSTLQLAEIIKRFVPETGKGKIHPATKCFMALRIVVNRELEQLEAGLLAAARVLKAGGRLAIISFNSLEDKIVKNFLNPKEDNNRYFPQEKQNQHPFKPKHNKPIIPGHEEIVGNPRARSAKLRVGIRNNIQDEFSYTSMVPKFRYSFV